MRKHQQWFPILTVLWYTLIPQLWRYLMLRHRPYIWWRHQMETFPRYWPFVRGIHRSLGDWPFVRGIHRPLVDSPHKGQWRGALMFSLIFAWTYGWPSNQDAGDLRRHRAHYDVTVMRGSSWVLRAGRYYIDLNQGYLLQYIPRNMHTVFALLCFVVVIHWLIFPYPSGLLHWHCGNLTIASVPVKLPWWIWINISCGFIMNDCITTTKQSTTKPCAYFLGYTVYRHPWWYTYTQIHGVTLPSLCDLDSDLR